MIKFVRGVAWTVLASAVGLVAAAIAVAIFSDPVMRTGLLFLAAIAGAVWTLVITEDKK
jgi:glucose uptake protein GlcU